MDPEEVRGRVQVFLMKERIKKYRAQQKVYEVRLFLEEHRNYDPRSRWWEDYPERRSPESGKTQPRDDKGKYKKYVDSENGLTSGENSGTIISNKGLLKQKSSQLRKSRKSLDAQIQKHRNKIAHPEGYSNDWNILSQEKKNGRIKHWEKEIHFWKVQIQEINAILKSRGDDDDQ